jgi:MFS family permease
VTETVSKDREARRRSPARIVLAGAAGNFVEWFDFTLYGFSAAVIAATFFPADQASAALLGTFAIYGVAFVARPLGAVVFGRIGDRAHRVGAAHGLGHRSHRTATGLGEHRRRRARPAAGVPAAPGLLRGR